MNTSITHLSHSAITNYLQCPKKWAEAYLADNRGPVTPPLIKGRAVHRLAELNWNQKRETHEDMALVDALGYVEDVYRNEVDEAGGRTAIDWQKDNFATALESTMRLSQAHMVYHAGRVTPLATEVRFERPISPERTLLGFIDAIDANGDVIDVKTGSRKMASGDADRDLQASAYAFGLARPITFHLFRVIDSGKKTASAEIVTTERNQRGVEWFEELAQGVSILIDAGVYPARPGWWCGNCPINLACIQSITPTIVQLEDTDE